MNAINNLLLQSDIHMTPFWDMKNLLTGKKSQSQLDQEKDSVCSDRMSQDIAIIDIMFSNQFVTKMKQNVRVSFTDKISNIG